MKNLNNKIIVVFLYAFALFVHGQVLAGELGQPDGMPVKLGQKISEVQSLLKTNIEPESYHKPILDTAWDQYYLDLKTRGMYLTFRRGFLIKVIFQKPFPSAIGGVSIDDSIEKLKLTIGSSLIESYSYKGKECPPGSFGKYTHYYDDITTITYTIENGLVKYISVAR